LDKQGHKRALLCFARKDGKLLWQQETKYEDNEPTHETNPYCSATPVTDGERVIASHGSAGLVCYDFKGKEQWRYATGKQYHIFGNASSPILHGDLCILWCGPGKRQFLVAVDKKTGRRIWQHDEPGGDPGDPKSVTWIGSWSTPIVVRVNGHDELILAVPFKVRGLNPNTGRELWWCDGLDRQLYASPVSSPDGIVVLLSGFNGPDLAVRAGGTGDVTNSHRLWYQDKRMPERVGSPVVVGDHCFLASTKGFAACFELKTGKQVWNERLVGDSWSSITAAGGRLYVPTREGTCHVLAATSKFEQLAVNKLDEQVLSSIAISDGDLFIRSYRNLWCIAEKK
jgi:outer membrane protein assembly factor BamB